MENWQQTLISQYANSPILVGLIESINDAIDPSTNIDAFYNYVWNVDTAQGYGLDVWGRIVGVSRNISVPTNFGNYDAFGFNTGVPSHNWQPFNQAPFWSASRAGSSSVALSDDAFRTVILVKAFSNIAATNIPTLNKLVTLLFEGLGHTNPKVYVVDNGGMAMTYAFNFALSSTETAIVNVPGLLPHPTGVQVNIRLMADNAHTFGFNTGTANNWQPFEYGTFGG